MFGVRILLFLVAFLMVIVEFFVGAVLTSPEQMVLSIFFGGVVITLLLGISIFLLAPIEDQKATGGGSVARWGVLIIAGMGISAISFFVPTYFLPMFTGMELYRP